MNTLITLLALLFVLQSCDEIDMDYDEPKGTTKTELAKINKTAQYNRILVAGAANVYLSKGPKHKVVLKGNPNHFKYVTLAIQGNTLKCDTRDGHISNLDVDIYVTLPEIVSINLVGAGAVEMSSFGQIANLDIDISGAGNFETRGKATRLNNLDISISGAGSVEADDLISQNVEVSVSGAGSAEVHAIKTLDASVSGVGSIEYEGNPKVRKRVSGIGSISRD